MAVPRTGGTETRESVLVRRVSAGHARESTGEQDSSLQLASSFIQGGACQRPALSPCRRRAPCIHATGDQCSIASCFST